MSDHVKIGVSIAAIVISIFQPPPSCFSSSESGRYGVPEHFPVFGFVPNMDSAYVTSRPSKPIPTIVSCGKLLDLLRLITCRL